MNPFKNPAYKIMLVVTILLLLVIVFYKEEMQTGENTGSAQSTNEIGIGAGAGGHFEIENDSLSATGESEKIKKQLNTLIKNLNELPLVKATNETITLKKAVLQKDRILLLYFNKAFQSIAAHEDSLTDFSEQLTFLRQYNIKNTRLFVGQVPLGSFLKELDNKRQLEYQKSIRPSKSSDI